MGKMRKKHMQFLTSTQKNILDEIWCTYGDRRADLDLRSKIIKNENAD